MPTTFYSTSLNPRERWIATYHDYFLLAAWVGVLAMFPTLPWVEVWRAVQRAAGVKRTGDMPEAITLHVAAQVVAGEIPSNGQRAPAPRQIKIGPQRQ